MTPVRPRLLYFNGPWDYLGRRIISAYIEPFQRLLEQDFEVVSVSGNRDLRSEVEKHAPDLILFHTGTESKYEKEVTITRIDAYPEIPRIGFVFRDPISPSRVVAINRLRNWKVEQVFTVSRPSDSADGFFDGAIYIPWWIDDRLFRDYGEEKRYPVTLAGAGWLSRQFFYTWRFPVFAALVSELPVFHVPVQETDKNADAYIGEAYARLLNRSRFSGGCGSVNRFVTLKLLEIAAARCCLITQETDVVKALGFRDGVNCIFADEKTVVGRVRALLDNPVRWQEITDAGFRLVHERHTQRNRRMFIEWFRLRQVRRTGQRIVQSDPFSSLQLVSDDSVVRLNFPTENPLVDGLRGGYELLQEKRWREALAKFEEALAVVSYMAEARLGAAIAQIHLGDFEAAGVHLLHNVHVQKEQNTIGYPDVLTHAYLAAVLARVGKWDQAYGLLASRSAMKHPALNAIRWYFGGIKPTLAKTQPAFAVKRDDESQTTESFHLLPGRSFAEWVAVWRAIVQSDTAASRIEGQMQKTQVQSCRN